MQPLTTRQKEILEFITRSKNGNGLVPSLREIAAEFGFKSVNAAKEHVGALVRKGALKTIPGKARALKPVFASGDDAQDGLIRIPLFGTIPAGFSDGREQDGAIGCISIDPETLGIKPGPRTFALQVRGDSMIGRHIVDGDYVVCIHGLTPRPGSIVAALIDNESTLKTYVKERGKTWLKAENPRFPDLIPARELVIQGVVVSVIRKLEKP